MTPLDASLSDTLPRNTPPAVVCTSFDEADAEADDRFLESCNAKFTQLATRNAFASALPELRTGRQGEAAADIALRYGVALPPRIGYSNAYWRAVLGRM